MLHDSDETFWGSEAEIARKEDRRVEGAETFIDEWGKFSRGQADGDGGRHHAARFSERHVAGFGRAAAECGIAGGFAGSQGGGACE
jgi:hypothetical protein